MGGKGVGEGRGKKGSGRKGFDALGINLEKVGVRVCWGSEKGEMGGKGG